MAFPLENGRPDVGSLLQFSKNKGLGTRLQWRIQGRAPLIFRPKWGPKGRKIFSWGRPPPPLYVRAWMVALPPTPSSEGLDPPLGCFCEDPPPLCQGLDDRRPHSLIWRSGSTTGLSPFLVFGSKYFSEDLCYGLVFFIWKGSIDHTALLSVALAILDRTSICNDSFSVYVICRIDQFRSIKTHTWLRGLGE